MKKNLMGLSIFALFSNVYAADFVDIARVVSSDPIYKRVNDPRRECWNESVQTAPRARSMGGAVVGGMAGGLLGSQVGRGQGNTAATAAGAIIGAMTGDNISNPNSNHSAAGSLIGGIAGALLGSQVGGGAGKTAATAAGGLAGVLIGNRVANPGQQVTQSGYQQVRRCRDVPHSRDVINGYNVTYRYNGQLATVKLPYKPGKTVRVGVSLIQDQTRQDRYQNNQNYSYSNGDRSYSSGERD
ncbi:MAG: glycine zipper 2TM domain-containing protein [Gallionella sp.]